MSLLAGIYSINKKQKIKEEISDQFRKEIARTKGTVESYSSSDFFLLKYDFEAFKQAGYIDTKSNVCAIAGEPFFDIVDGQIYSRSWDLSKLSKQLSKEGIRILKRCSGTYSICYYDKIEHSLILATDKTGERPLYYFYDNSFLYFSSSIRLLEGVRSIPKKLNLNAIIEQAVFGIPLGENTQYCDIRVLRDGQCIECKEESPSVTYYFRWDEIKPTKMNSDELLNEAFIRFKSAISIRMRDENATSAFLSGGLDSRCVVSILNSLGMQLTTFNFSLAGEQDEAFAAQYANHIGANYIAAYRPVGDWTWGSLISDALERVGSQSKRNTKYPRLIFSGDGGSVGVGHVYMDDTLLKLLERRKINEALSYFLRKRGFPRKVINPDLLTSLEKIPFVSLKREFEDITGIELGRAFHLFLLRNDQRRHLHSFYEDIDLYRVEFLLPFYDARLLELIISAPVEQFLRHEFYHKWLHFFPDDTRSVPWQTYPGHVRCPVSHNGALPSQWENDRKKGFRSSKVSINKWWKIIFVKDFPKEILRRPIIFLAMLLHLIRFNDYSYLYKFSRKICDYYWKCNGANIER